MRTPTLSELLRTAMSAKMTDVHTAIPAKVLSYDSTKQSVSVQPLIRRGYVDAAGERQVESLPVINGVPVSFPGSGNFSITWPLAEGDTGLLLFAEASIDKWKSYGGEVDPMDDRRFHLSDAVFVPGLRPFNSAIPSTGVHATAMVIQSNGAIHAGGSSALALKADIDALRAWAATHTHIGCAPGGVLDLSGAPSTPGPPSAAGTTILKGA